MPKDVYLDFSGSIKLDPNTRMQYTGNREWVDQVITIAEWQLLSLEKRSEYILENFADAYRDGEDLEFEELDVSEEKEIIVPFLVR